MVVRFTTQRNPVLAHTLCATRASRPSHVL
jgi:hypothetical protein